MKENNPVKHIIVSDKPLDFLPTDPSVLTMSATDFIANKVEIDLRKHPLLKVINLCSNFDYLSKGYYCSLLAEARGMRCVPPVANIVTLNWKRNYQSELPELNALLEKHFKEEPDEPLARTYTAYFGRCKIDQLEPLARRLFDMFRFPLMQVEIKADQKGKWVINDIAPLSLAELPVMKQDYFISSLQKFTGSAWRSPQKKKEKYWIAILHDPEEHHAPSNKAALQKFIKAGKELNVSVELITKNDFSSLLEYDGLLIRETTAINHHTYRFALKAESEDIPSIDDTHSIIRCCNKVFQYEILHAHRIPLPKTWILDRKSAKTSAGSFSFPLVVKIPDGAFSVGVIKVEKEEKFQAAVSDLLKKSEIILVQEFVQSEFDWRVGVLDGQPLFACKYFMADGHWQIYNHDSKTKKGQEGDHVTMAVEDVPAAVMDVAIKAAKLIGDGLYGVDLKQFGDDIVVMEVNDNPNLDAGIEDQHLGDRLYRIVLESLIARIENR
ncbi:MAG: RimK family protein [Pseudomonadota bacterium]|nr:ATP-grasp domain-containing protein [Pseudomonadota bacterium]QKK05660.1 MAG: RimK family protein [Pseudomonadota bacterium]